MTSGSQSHQQPKHIRNRPPVSGRFSRIQATGAPWEAPGAAGGWENSILIDLQRRSDQVWVRWCLEWKDSSFPKWSLSARLTGRLSIPDCPTVHPGRPDCPPGRPRLSIGQSVRAARLSIGSADCPCVSPTARARGSDCRGRQSGCPRVTDGQSMGSRWLHARRTGPCTRRRSGSICCHARPVRLHSFVRRRHWAPTNVCMSRRWSIDPLSLLALPAAPRRSTSWRESMAVACWVCRQSTAAPVLSTGPQHLSLRS